VRHEQCSSELAMQVDFCTGGGINAKPALAVAVKQEHAGRDLHALSEVEYQCVVQEVTRRQPVEILADLVLASPAA
jgi:hypothetical protein